MSQVLSFAIFVTGAGWMGATASAAGLLRLTLPCPSTQKVREELGSILDQATSSPQLFQDIIERLRAYFHGEKVSFPDRLDFAGATAFQRAVWEAARRIPYGETRSYAWVAGQINKPKAVRAVGQTLGKNRWPIIIPCHRVIASNGDLTGYRGGLEMKRHLISLEATAVT